MFWDALFGSEGRMKATCFILIPFVLAGGFNQPYLLWRVGTCVMAVLLLAVAVWDKIVPVLQRIRDSVAEKRRRRFEQEWERIVDGAPED